METRILVLDDQIHTATVEIYRSLLPLLPENAIFDLNGTAPVTVRLRAVDGVQPSLTFICNAVDSATQVKRLIESRSFEGEFDLVLLDDHWGTTPNEQFAGQKLLLEATLRHVQGRNGEPPLVCLWTQHWEQDFRTSLFAEALWQSPYRGKDKIRGLSKTNHAGLLLMIQELVAVSELTTKDAQLEGRISVARAGRAKHLGLVNSQEFKEKIVAPEPFIKFAELVEPFFQWKTGNYETKPRNVRLKFPVGFILEGDDEVFVDAFSDGLAAALTDSQHNLSSRFDIATDEERDQRARHPFETLLEVVAELYAYAAEERVVVIRADDIEILQDLENPEMDHALSVTQHLRSYLDSANQINAGQDLTDFELRSRIKEVFQRRQGQSPSRDVFASLPLPGKILWLFRRDGNAGSNSLLEVVAPMLPPAITIDFSDNDRIRRRVLKAYARKRDCDFNNEALNAAVRGTRGLNFGKLIGRSEWVAGSFLSMVEQKAKLATNFSYQEEGGINNDGEIRVQITRTVVQEVLDELRLVPQPASAADKTVIADDGAAGSNVSARVKARNRRRLANAETKLDEYEQVAEEINNERPMKSEQLRIAIALKLEVTPNSITTFSKEYARELRFLLNSPNNADRWRHLRQIQTFSKHINRPIERFD